MEKRNRKQVGGSASSFTMDLFGPKDHPYSSSSSSANGLFGSVFGPPSTGLGRDFSYPGTTGAFGNHDVGSQYGYAKHGTPENSTQRSKGEGSGIERTTYHNETVEPCYFSSSIYYGGQEVYSPKTQTAVSPVMLKKDGGEDDPNGGNLNSASRGNWWQGSLYY